MVFHILQLQYYATLINNFFLKVMKNIENKDASKIIKIPLNMKKNNAIKGTSLFVLTTLLKLDQFSLLHCYAGLCGAQTTC